MPKNQIISIKIESWYIESEQKNRVLIESERKKLKQKAKGYCKIKQDKQKDTDYKAKTWVLI